MNNLNNLKIYCSYLVKLIIATAMQGEDIDKRPVEYTIEFLRRNNIYCSHDTISSVANMYRLNNNNPLIFKIGNMGQICTYDEYKYSKILTPIEFSKYVGNENITWNDLVDVLLNNNNVADREKKILLEGIKLLSKSNININLGVLKYNLEHLRVIDKLKGKKVKNELASFNANDCTVYLTDETMKLIEDDFDWYKRIIIHEVLGHGSNIAYINKDNGVFCSDHFMSLLAKKNKVYGFNIIGQALDEAVAEYIVAHATGYKLDVYESPYTPFVYFLLMSCKILNITVEDYINNGCEWLLRKFLKLGIEDGTNCSQLLDMKFSNYISDGRDNTGAPLLYVYIPLINNYAYRNYTNNISYMDNYNMVMSVIDSYKDYIELDDGDNIVSGLDGDSININMLKEYVTQYLYDLYNYRIGEYKSPLALA